ncbi:MAG: L-glyceraldehyde 3-phosphate reductase, partial [Pedobacter sp.]
TDKYLHGIPADSRVATSGIFLKETNITPEKLAVVTQLNELAKSRGQKLSHMALSWILKDKRITSVLIGASKPEQITDSIRALDNTTFSDEEIKLIDEILK